MKPGALEPQALSRTLVASLLVEFVETAEEGLCSPLLSMCYECATQARMKQLNLREANQGFSRLVREIERTGERVLVLRNGKPAVEIVPAGEGRAVHRRSPEQERAIRAFLESARMNPGDSSGERRWTRNELHER